MASTGQGPGYKDRGLPARAFARSLTMVLKYVRLYGFEHQRTQAQFQVAWQELRAALAGPAGLLLGVAGSKLLLDGVALNTGAAERGFIELLTAADIASLQFLPSVTQEEFQQLIRAFSASKPAEVLQQLKRLLPQGPNVGIRLNEVRYVEDDNKEGPDMAAQLTARVLGEDQTAINLGDWLSDPQKLLQLIFAAQGVDKPGGGEGDHEGGTGGDIGAGGPVDEGDVMGIMRWLTQLGRVQAEANQSTAGAALQAQLAQLPPNSISLVRQTLAQIAALPRDERDQETMLVKLAEHLAIRFALERYERGDVKVNAVRELLDRMNVEMENLRKILRSHEQAMGRAGVTVETHAQILDRQFWAAVPEPGKLTVLLSPEAACIPGRNVRSFVEELIERGESQTAVQVLRHYVACIASSEAELRRRTAVGLTELADLYARLGADLMLAAVKQTAEQLMRETTAEQVPLITAGLVRLTQEAINARQYYAMAKSLETIPRLEEQDRPRGQDLRMRIAVEARVREFLEDALKSPVLPAGLAEVLRCTPRAAAEHVAIRFGECTSRQECDRLLELLAQIGQGGIEHLQTMLQSRTPSEAVSCVAVRSRIDLAALEQDLQQYLPKWGRLQHDELIRQLSFGGAPERGRVLLAVLPLLHPLLRPRAVEEAGLSGDPDIVPALLELARGEGLASDAGYLQLKAVEALGRVGDHSAIELLNHLVSGRSLLGWQQAREIRIAAAQALRRMGATITAVGGLTTEELQLTPLEVSDAGWARPRRHLRVSPARRLNVTAITNKGRTKLSLSSISLGGGVVNREQTRGTIGPDAVLEVSRGMGKVRLEVIVRENRARELTFEILNVDLQDLNRLRHIILEQLAAAR